MSYQPEERYWTDYLRVALPVIGLLLMLGLFWYWASSVIGDDGSKPKPTPTANVELIVTQPAPTAAPTQAFQLTPQQSTQQPTPDVAAPTSATDGGNQDPTAEATSDAGTGENASQYQVGDTVVTVDQVNLRAGPSVSEAIVEPLPPQSTLSVVGPGVEADGYIWIEVQDESGVTGYVADEFVQIQS